MGRDDQVGAALTHDYRGIYIAVTPSSDDGPHLRFQVEQYSLSWVRTSGCEGTSTLRKNMAERGG
jgi:hypothetical protein